ncbi:universal stress protein [Neisseria sp. CCUG12390]|uniref:universal stress protein n=1 Tax=Neisseria sp. CCUG12390 TaxID=3392035 RepID=UPI003A0FD3C2
MLNEYRNILVAVDGSPQAEKAFHKAAAIAVSNHSRLVIAHILDQSLMQHASLLTQNFHDKLETEAQKLLEGYALHARDSGVDDVAILIETGNPKQLLSEDIPQRENIDLIVLGATGLNALERMLVGSSSSYIVQNAEVDVLVVRTE